MTEREEEMREPYYLTGEHPHPKRKLGEGQVSEGHFEKKGKEKKRQ